jgi:DNA-directed RNA polymerase subunit RPC12/RpoP
MKCWHCREEVIWGGDHDIEEDSYMSEEYLIETNMSCPKCGSFYLVYYPKGNNNET